MTGFTPEEWRTAARIARRSIFTEGNPDLADAWDKAADQAEARLIPAGGMALTAEQVEDMRTVAGDDGELAMTGEFWAARDRLRALFPATEPEEERRRFPTIQDIPNNTLFHTHGGEGSSLFVRNQSGDLRLCLNAGTEWSKLLQETDFPPSSGPYIEVPWSKFPKPWADPFALPAPAEPAEEETKAEDGTLEALRDLFNGGPDTAIRTTWHDGAEYWEVPAEDMRKILTSSPVAPAPTETGPWQHRDGRICVYAPAVTPRLRYRIGEFNDHGDFVHAGSGRELPEGFAPFVAAEEGGA